jgi:8-oxo-dGTP pyrophosphatase MutT (NUDIX family)
VIDLNFDDALSDQIRRRLAQLEWIDQSAAELRRAAVALTLIRASEDPDANNIPWKPEHQNEPAVLLTRRSARLNKHAGQWALPGGAIDPGESVEQAALRELEEEVGLDLDASAIMGRLDDYTTRSGFCITPVVIWGGETTALIPNPDEVASIHRIPVKEFLREDAPILDTIPESEHPVLRMPVGDSWIAAPTAAILYQFREVAVYGRNTRVAHFEQPHFAWR